MKMQYERIIHNPNMKTLMTSPNYCCEKLNEAFDNKIIGFGDINFEADENNNFVNLYFYDKDEENFDLIPINFCPFCGDRIKTEEVHLN